jgi:hypothetical protein
MTAVGAWQPDPIGEASWRWWDGGAWSAQTGPARPTPELAPFPTAAGRSIMLNQHHPSGTDVFECDGYAIGTLHTPSFGDATAECASGAWLFDREGIIHGAARVIVQPSNQEIGRFDWDGIGTGTDGLLRFTDGRWFRLARAKQLAQEGVTSPADYDPSHAVWVWYGADRAPVSTVRMAEQLKTKKIFGKTVHYHSSSTGKTRDNIWIDLHAPAARTRELPVLTTLATYLIWWSTTQREAMQRRHQRH